jgi:cob(I)alamin adenosyltransferase
MLHVYYGDGKGKTTAALGLILRARGCGNACVLVQFLKDFATGELETLASLGVPVYRGKAKGPAFTKDMTAEQREETRLLQNQNFADALVECARSRASLLVLDEALDALSLGLLREDALRALLDAPPEGMKGLEIVITGHKPIGWVLERADYITEMRKLAHPFDKGIRARKGVEF